MARYLAAALVLAAMGCNGESEPVPQPSEKVTKNAAGISKTDSENFIEQLGSWGQHWVSLMQNAADLSDAKMKEGNLKQGYIYLKLSSTLSDLITEVKSLAVAERLAALATTDLDKQQAARIMSRHYADLLTLVVSSDRTILQECVQNLREVNSPESAAEVESKCLEYLNEFEKEMLTTRKTYWSAKTIESQRE